MKPLNGTKTHPLKPASLAALRALAEGPAESFLLNPGVRDRLSRGGLAEEYISKAGRRCYRITDAGRAALATS